MSTIAVIVIITLFTVLFSAMAILPALIEPATSSPSRPRLVVIESRLKGDGSDEEPRAA